MRLRRARSGIMDEAIKECLHIISKTRPRSHPSAGTLAKKSSRQLLSTLAAGLQVGAMLVSQSSLGPINDPRGGTTSEMRCLVCRVTWRHLGNGLSVPGTEPFFLPRVRVEKGHVLRPSIIPLALFG